MRQQLQAEEIILVFTDIVKSTELEEKYREVFLRAQDEHRRIIRDGLVKWRGAEINVQGDGFFLVFRDALDAAQWAVETQALLLKHDWPLRMDFKARLGMHLGRPKPMTHPSGRADYEGSAVVRAKRIMDEALGGHIFVSQEFYDRVKPLLPLPFEFHARGARELRGMGFHSIWQMLHPDMPDDSNPAPPPEVPSTHLPSRPNAHFCGRADFLAALRAHLLAPNRRAVALVGMGGMGKTQIALEYGHAHLMDYPGGVYWLDARNEESLLADYAAIGKQFFGMEEALGGEAKDLGSEAAEWARSAMQRQKKPALLIFDNVTDKNILDWLPPSGSLHLLLTTQQQTLPANLFLMETPPLTEEAALNLLQSFQEARGDEELEAARQIARRVGNLPLALAVASHHIRALGCRFAEYWGRLKDDPLKELGKGRDRFVAATKHTGSIYDTIALSVRGEECGWGIPPAVERDALKILAATACFAPNSIPNGLLFRATGIENYDAFEDAASSLWERSLLRSERGEGDEGRKFVHELVREYARIELLPDCRSEILRGAVPALTQRLREANRAMEWTAFRSDMPHCYAIAAPAQSEAPPPALEELLLEIGTYLAEHRDCKKALEYYDAGLALAEQRQGAGSLLAARFLRLMGEAQQQEERPAEALRHVRAARRLARRTLAKDALEMADYCNSLGFVLKMQRHLKRALPFYLRALQLYQTGPQARQSDAAGLLNNIGTLLEAQEDLRGALEYFQRARSAAEAEGGENIVLVYFLNNAGRVLIAMGRYEEARPLHERARKIAEAARGARHLDTAACWYYLAEAQRGLGQQKKALTNYRRAARIYRTELGPEHPINQRAEDRIASLEAGEN